MSGQPQATFSQGSHNVSVSDTTINSTIHIHGSQTSDYTYLVKQSRRALCMIPLRETLLRDAIQAPVNLPSKRYSCSSTIGSPQSGYVDIAQNIPGMKEHVNNTIDADPSLPSKSIEAQLIPLLVVPLKNYSPSLSHTIIHRIPLRFVVASRPEAHLEEYFKKEPLCAATSTFTLDDDYESMWKCYRDNFNQISNSRRDVIFGVPTSWPADDIVDNLVVRASNPWRFTAFSEMDALYTQIITICPSYLQKCFLRTVGAIIVLRGTTQAATTIAALSDLLNEKSSNITTILRSLRAVININDSNFHRTFYKLFSPELYIYHLSKGSSRTRLEQESCGSTYMF
ncbi:hypothetical protein CPB83DRAFT_899518 [Crepidotus variabilis]|uniref:Uncharacterized protein n=1 Tax=Crepidotus variabilis TaxID=179855 RepID=A0A9P6E4Y3_9AGAR|nr:hypothetical protein CPB83DRAFT_899518 [Crepidotus variabilis]